MKKKKRTGPPAVVETPLVKLGLALVGAVTWPLAWLPVRAGLALGAGAGRLAYALSAERRRIALGNIEMIKANGSLPADLDGEAVAREAFANLGRSVWEVLRFYHRGLDPFWNDCVVEEGREHLEAVAAESRRTGLGPVMITAHSGNWELMCHYVPVTFDLRLTVVGRLSGRPLADALIHRLRVMGGNGFAAKDGGARDMIRALKSGGALGTLIDQAIIGNHPQPLIPFLGREATTNLGPIRLARRLGAPLIMMLFRREGRRHLVTIKPVVQPRTDLAGEEALEADARQLNDWLSEFVQRHPEQWMWGHRRWKTRDRVRGGDRRSLT